MNNHDFVNLYNVFEMYCEFCSEARIDELEAQVKELKEEIGALDDLEKVVILLLFRIH